MNPSIFWMIYGVGQGAPTVRHRTYDSAKTEAARLARNNPGIEFFILQSRVMVRKVDVEFVDVDEIPF